MHQPMADSNSEQAMHYVGIEVFSLGFPLLLNMG